MAPDTTSTQKWHSSWYLQNLSTIYQADFRLEEMKMEMEMEAVLPPAPDFRNHSGDLDKPALVFEVFPRLPLELRRLVWSFCESGNLITLDGPGHYSNIVQVLPQNLEKHKSNPMCIRSNIRSKCTLLKTTHEARQAVFDSMESYIWLDTGLTLGTLTLGTATRNFRKLIFSEKGGDIIFINILKMWAESLLASGLQNGLKDSFESGITTLAVHDSNFHTFIHDSDEGATVMEVADILSKFTSLTNLWIVRVPIGCRVSLALDTELVETEDIAVASSSDANEMHTIISLTRAISLAAIRVHFETYASTRPNYKVPNIKAMDIKRRKTFARRPEGQSTGCTALVLRPQQ